MEKVLSVFQFFLRKHRFSKGSFMELFLFKDLLVIFCFSILVILVGYRFNLPPVVGFLVTGVIAGPHGLGLVEKLDDVERLAQIGIILLLFGIGLEFSIKKLIKVKKFFLLGGSLQVGLTILISTLVGQISERPWGESIFIGSVLAMSSTAIVIRFLEQKGETQSPHGKLAIAILIFQDMIAIPIILLTPFLISTGAENRFDPSTFFLLGKGLVILAFAFICAQRIVPPLLDAVAKTRNKELFLLTVLAICFGVAWLTSSLGLSLTIGAFTAGLILSESEYSHEAISHIFPFQALFISFFFVSVGMLLNVDFLIHHVTLITALAIGALTLKALIGAVSTLILRMPLRTAVLTGIAISQIGEFSFVLAKTGFSLGLGTDYYYQLFLAVSILTLAISPVLISFSQNIASWFTKLPFPDKLKTGAIQEDKNEKKKMKDHLIIVGFGISGKNLARSSKIADIPYVILEMNPDTVKEERAKGEPIFFGDASHLSILEHFNVHKAKAIAILINDPIAARHTVKITREVNSSIYIIVRTRYVQEMALMTRLGADEVIPDEFGTSIEIFSRVLRQYHVPEGEIHQFIADIRADGYELLRNQGQTGSKLSEIKLNLSNVEMSSFRLHPSSAIVGKSLMESQLRQEHGVTVLLIKRGSKVISNPPPETELMANDVLVVIGEKEVFKQAAPVFGAV